MTAPLTAELRASFSTGREKVTRFRAGYFVSLPTDPSFEKLGFTSSSAVTKVATKLTASMSVKRKKRFKRITQQQDKEFWTEVLLFVSKDENLNKAHIKFLEFTAYSAAVAASRYKVTNGNIPNKPAISEVEQAVMMEFFENLRLLTGALGYKLFEPLIVLVANPEDEYFISAVRGANARAILTNDGVVVRKDSEIATTVVPSTPEPLVKLREKLIQDGDVAMENSKLVFSRDYLFGSPSTAAAIVLGRSANGRIEWKDSQGRTIKDKEE